MAGPNPSIADAAASEGKSTTMAAATTSSSADVEAIGAHCHMPFCHQLDFLPFRCESCGKKFCLDHRSETAHDCSQAGAWARRKCENELGTNSASAPTKPRTTILNHEQQCAEVSCKTLIHTSLVTGVHCEKCRRNYCLKHRFGTDHACATLKPLGVKEIAGPTQRERGLAALEKLRLWGLGRKSGGDSSASGKSKSKTSAASRLAEINTLKRTAKGDAKVPLDKRVYLYVEATNTPLASSSSTPAANAAAAPTTGKFFYSLDHSIGRILDAAARDLHIQNHNNRVDDESDRLRVFWIEGGRLLPFGEKLGASGVKTGDTIVLLRGVGLGLPDTPERAGA